MESLNSGSKSDLLFVIKQANYYLNFMRCSKCFKKFNDFKIETRRHLGNLTKSNGYVSNYLPTEETCCIINKYLIKYKPYKPYSEYSADPPANFRRRMISEDLSFDNISYTRYVIVLRCKCGAWKNIPVKYGFLKIIDEQMADYSLLKTPVYISGLIRITNRHRFE